MNPFLLYTINKKIIILYYIFIKSYYSKILFGTSKPNSITIKSCKNLIKALDLNTGAYNKCLFSNLGEKYTAEELKACQDF